MRPETARERRRKRRRRERYRQTDRQTETETESASSAAGGSSNGTTAPFCAVCCKREAAEEKRRKEREGVSCPISAPYFSPLSLHSTPSPSPSRHVHPVLIAALLSSVATFPALPCLLLRLFSYLAFFRLFSHPRLPLSLLSARLSLSLLPRLFSSLLRLVPCALLLSSTFDRRGPRLCLFSSAPPRLLLSLPLLVPMGGLFFHATDALCLSFWAECDASFLSIP